MHCCEFCSASFQPRPQVKNPRACAESSCQRKRQRANEREWRTRHSVAPGSDYHRIRRRQRHKLLKEISRRIFECIEVGSRFLNRSFNEVELQHQLSDFSLQLGIRRANKLCLFDLSLETNELRN